MKYYLESPIGNLEINISDKGLESVEIIGEIRDSGNHEIVDKLRDYFDGKDVDFSNIQLDYGNLSEFSVRVLKSLREIPNRQTRSYKWVADRAGSPKAVRAAGQVIKRNPHSIIAPCHRVIKSDGSLGGFFHGQEMKKQILKIEKNEFISDS